ncbi:hypothetical protein M1512_04785 [Patescibacteria group bacterium]|nr:hypothetical protein [Patescibacteria group bacterium]
MISGQQKTSCGHGFTIIETMIFLAVSGVTFLIATAFISGKEAQGEYTQGMLNANSFVQSIINNVSDGNYPQPSRGKLTCINVSSTYGPNVGIITSGAPNRLGCSLIGDILAPSVNNSPSTYAVLLVTGCQFYNYFTGCQTSGGLPPTTISEYEANAVCAVKDQCSGQTITKSNNWPGGLDVNKLLIVNSTGSIIYSIGAIGFFSTPPNQSGELSESGAQTVQAVFIPNSSLGQSTDQVAQEIPRVTWLNSSDYILMCFNGLGGKTGSITIGGAHNGRQLTTKVGMGNQVARQC